MAASLASPFSGALARLLELTWNHARKTLVLLTGSTLLVVGALLLLLPGPGLLVIALALAVLGTEFLWARSWLERVRERLGELRGGVQNLVERARGPR